MKKSRWWSAGLAAGLAVLWAPGAGAQEFIPVEIPTELNQAGAGVFAVPDFYGSKDYHAEGAGFAHLNFGNGMWLELLGPEIRLNIIPRDFAQDYPPLQGLRLGPIVRWRPNRETDVHDDVVSRMERIPSATELGGFIAYHLPLDSNPMHKFVFSGDMTWNTNHVYGGSVGSVRASYFHPFRQGLMGMPLVGSVGLGLFMASDDFNDRYFGVDGPDRLAFGADQQGLPYQARGGLSSVRLPFSLSARLDRHWTLTMAGRYERLLEDAADSPIVRKTGDENQWLIGVSANYVF